MPMGLKNAPAIHQRRVTLALRPYLGKICHIYLDDIVIWSNSIEEHEKNVSTILQALCNARLYMNPEKMHLFCLEIDFLGHHISARGIEADAKKADHIVAWPQPKTATDVHAFLGLVRYLSAFLPSLAEHTGILTKLTTKESEKNFPTWTPRYQSAFDSVKSIVTSRDCLTTIDLSKLPEYKIFVTTDASDKCSGAVLSFSTDWETARPVAFDSMTFKGAELNYPVHEKELLTIIHALKKWSECTNKTVNQALRFHIERNQLGWARALPRIRFDIMNTINKSTGFTPFQLQMGHSPHMIPPLVPAKSNATVTDIDAWHVICQLEMDVFEVQDNLLCAKISQSVQSNKHHSLKFLFRVGSPVRLSTSHHRNKYKAKGEKRVAKFMPLYNSPYTITNVDEKHSTITLNLPNSPNIFPVFHTSEILPFMESDISLFPSRRLEEPPPILTEDSDEEYFIEKILDAHRCGRGYQYLVRWKGYSTEEDRWLPSSKLQDCEALDVWLNSRVGSPLP